MPDPKSRIISETRFVPASAEAVFEVLADPAMHPVIDGSETVRKAREDAPKRLFMGAKFGMDMTLCVDYNITNEVVEFEEARQIGWRHFGGHVWRYLLEPAEGGTQVTEQFDWREAKLPLAIELAGFHKRNQKSMSLTLERLAKHFGG